MYNKNWISFSLDKVFTDKIWNIVTYIMSFFVHLQQITLQEAWAIFRLFSGKKHILS